MPRTVLRAALMIGATILFAWASQAAPPFGNLVPPSPASGNTVQWNGNLAAAHKIASAENKPILIVFGADWCHYCKKLEKETLNRPEMAQYINRTFVPVHLDADKDKKVVQTLKVTGLPCSVILTPDAKLIGRIEGYHKEPAYRDKLGDAEKNFELIRTAGTRPATK